jgi:hypothetical protein
MGADGKSRRDRPENACMKRTLIRYRTRPEAADANAKLVEDVFAELMDKGPDSLRYLSMRLEGDVFVHFVESNSEPSPLVQLDAFKTFQQGIRERCLEPPDPRPVTILGDYRMLGVR